jgi:hypothetical protein
LDIDGRRERARLNDQLVHVGAAPRRPLRGVAVEALKGGRGQVTFYSTCFTATAEQVIGWYHPLVSLPAEIRAHCLGPTLASTHLPQCKLLAYGSPVRVNADQ